MAGPIRDRYLHVRARRRVVLHRLHGGADPAHAVGYRLGRGSGGVARLRDRQEAVQPVPGRIRSVRPAGVQRERDRGAPGRGVALPDGMRVPVGGRGGRDL